MNKIEEKYYNTLFLKLQETWRTSKDQDCLNKLLGNPKWCFVPAVIKHREKIELKFFNKHVASFLKTFKLGTKKLDSILEAVKKSINRGGPVAFSYAGKKGCISLLKADGRVFGILVVLGVKSGSQIDLSSILQLFADTTVKNTQKDMELEDLNETIRPRSIALSTVHTVHRLMSSTLNLSELLPRIARLSLQVMRANRCSIKLLDKKKKTLLPMTTVDIRKTKAKLKKVEIGKYAPGRAVKQYRSIWGKNYLATPLIEGDVLGAITIYDKIDGSPFTVNDAEIMKTLSEQAVIAIKNAQLFQEQENLTMSSIKCIATLLKARPHGMQMGEASFLKLISIIGRKCDMNETEIKMMQYAGMLHDAGQISIPEKVLMKKGDLTGSELDIIKKHTLKGADILAKSKYLKDIVPIILYHHENYNGTGYPEGLKGEDIPVAARIMGIVSAFEAMITKKPYRKALSTEDAIEEVKKNAGTQFDPKIVNFFCEAATRKDVLKLLKRERDRD